jgi:hypothetical protein
MKPFGRTARAGRCDARPSVMAVKSAEASQRHAARESSTLLHSANRSVPVWERPHMVSDEQSPPRDEHPPDDASTSATANSSDAAATTPSAQAGRPPSPTGLPKRLATTPPIMVFLVTLGLSLVVASVALPRFGVIDGSTSNSLLTAAGVAIGIISAAWTAHAARPNRLANNRPPPGNSAQERRLQRRQLRRSLLAVVFGLVLGFIIPPLVQVPAGAIPAAPVSTTCPPPKEDTPSRLTLGERLDKGDSLRSPSGRYALIMRDDGVLSLCDTRTGATRWKAGTGEYPESYAELGLDGNFGLYTPADKFVWATNTYQSDAVAVAVEDSYSGRAVLETRRGDRHLWMSNGAAPVIEGSPPQVPNELRQWEVLKPGKSLRNGSYTLTMQKNGGLVLRSGDEELWRPETDTSDDYYSALAMQHDGNLVMYYHSYTPYPVAVWASNTDQSGAEVLRLEADGRLALYGAGGLVLSLFTP